LLFGIRPGDIHDLNILGIACEEPSMTGFMLKKVLSRFLFPLPMCIEILLVGLVLLWFTKKQKSGKIVVTVGTILLLLLSYNASSDPFLRELERRYPPYELAGPSELSAQAPGAAIKWVVVLGGGHQVDPHIPLSSKINHPTLVRLVEGMLLYRKNPGSKLVVSGGRVYGSISDAELMSRLAEAVGAPREDIIVEDQSWDTEDEARLLKPLVQNDAFILVTSASHMVRSMKLFESYGMHPIPAPTDHMVLESETFSPDLLFPEPNALVKVTRLVYEYLGLAWLKVRGVI
jgi:uncharacterized SAM-binding protein YcdF (DUF218 family)